MRRAWYAAPLLALLFACGQPQTSAPAMSAPPVVALAPAARAEMVRINTTQLAAPIPDQAVMTPTADPAPAAATPATAPAAQQLTTTDEAAPAAATSSLPAAYDANFVRVQVLLDRTHFSPGVIDGRPGENVANAVRAYRAANNLPAGAAIDAQLVQSLSADNADAIVAYTITEDDVRGPFVAIPGDLQAMSRLTRIGYQRASEGLAEKFHMDEDFLRALNPDADFAKAGQEILVANAGGDLPVQVAVIQVNKASASVSALDAQGNVVAHYPATIGSAAQPAPVGSYTVRAIAFDPTYHYDPARLPSFGPRPHGALTIAAGPNNPVGVVWMALSLDTYGIHGAPEPDVIGKTSSHGCVRLTNWDARELGRAIRAGVPVNFIEPGPTARGESPAREG